MVSALARHLGSTRAEADVVHADIGPRTATGAPATMRRWVLQEQVGTKMHTEARRADVTVAALRAAAALLLSAHRP